MNTAIPDLWPDFGAALKPAPVSILRHQGYILGQRTQNAVVGEVETRSEGPGKFLHQLYVTAPLLGYRQPIMHVKHGVQFYPAEVAFYNDGGTHRRSETVSDADAFMKLLREELAAPQVVNLIGSLVAQCQDSDSPA